MNEPNYKIVITDSGLGGLSVLSEIDKLLSKENINGIDLIFVNSLHGKDYGYNRMKDENEKEEKFNSVLEMIDNKFQPDLILIACNTLSAIYHKTKYADITKRNVIGIVEFGVEMIYERMKHDQGSRVIIYGTPTTVKSNAHRDKLIQKGIVADRIIYQPCYLLETEIQNDAGSKRVVEMISKFTGEAAKQINESCNIFATLGCTHYTYSRQIFETALSKHFGDKFEILNPNSSMSIAAVKISKSNSGNNERRIRVYSKTEIHEHEIKSIAKFLEMKSPTSVLALQNYELNRNLF